MRDRIDEISIDGFLVVMLCVLIFFLGSTLSCGLALRILHNRAYKAGVGHYVVNEASGKTDWVFECQACASTSNKLAAAALAKEEQAD